VSLSPMEVVVIRMMSGVGVLLDSFLSASQNEITMGSLCEGTVGGKGKLE